MNKIIVLKKQINQIEDIKKQEELSSEFKAWKRKTASLLERIFGKKSRQLKDFDDISYSLGAWSPSTPDYKFKRAYLKGLEDAEKILQSMLEEIEEFGIDQKEKSDFRDHLLNIFDKFHGIARQLRSRYNDRPTLDVEDEYDVQNLLHALLKLHFDDIRPEEWTPSYAGGSSRMDFLLKNERTVIEVKKTRKKLTDRQIGEQLLIDIEKYKEHPDCASLICFIYDPGGEIGNPKGLENDLNRNNDELDVKVIIKPS